MFTAGVHEQFIDIDRDGPRANTEFPQERVQPAGATSSFAVPICRPEQPDIGLAGQVFGAPIGGIVVDDEESIHSHIAIVLKKRRQAKHLLSAPSERANLPWTH